ALVKQAHQIAKQKKSAFLPRLDAFGLTSWNYLSKNGLFRSLDIKIDPTFDDTIVGLTFNYEFDFWGKYRNIFRAAIGPKKASEAEAAQAALILSTSVAESYYSLQTYLAKLSLLKETLEDRRTLFDLRTFRKNNSLDNQIETNTSEEDIFSIEKK